MVNRLRSNRRQVTGPEWRPSGTGYAPAVTLELEAGAPPYSRPAAPAAAFGFLVIGGCLAPTFNGLYIAGCVGHLRP